MLNAPFHPQPDLPALASAITLDDWLHKIEEDYDGNPNEYLLGLHRKVRHVVELAWNLADVEVAFLTHTGAQSA